ERSASNAGGLPARDELPRIILDVFPRLSADAVVARLEAAQIANARVNSMHDVWAHPQLKARARWTEVATPAGNVPALRPPGIPDTFAPRMDPVPALGEHSARILEGLGYSEANISAIRVER